MQHVYIIASGIRYLIISLFILIGGLFSLTSGQVLVPDFFHGSGANNIIHTISRQGDKILLGGEFTTYNGINRNRIVRLLSGGQVDMSFDPGAGANGPIYKILFKYPHIFVFGHFSEYDGHPVNNMVRLTLDGGIDTSISYTGTNGPIYDAVFYDRACCGVGILVGGDFSHRIMRLNYDFLYQGDRGASGINGPVYKIFPFFSNGAYAVGNFTLPRMNVIQLDSVGGVNTLSTLKSTTDKSTNLNKKGAGKKIYGANPGINTKKILVYGDDVFLYGTYKKPFSTNPFNNTIKTMIERQEDVYLAGGLFTNFTDEVGVSTSVGRFAKFMLPTNLSFDYDKNYYPTFYNQRNGTLRQYQGIGVNSFARVSLSLAHENEIKFSDNIVRSNDGGKSRYSGNTIYHSGSLLVGMTGSHFLNTITTGRVEIQGVKYYWSILTTGSCKNGLYQHDNQCFNYCNTLTGGQHCFDKPITLDPSHVSNLNLSTYGFSTGLFPMSGIISVSGGVERSADNGTTRTSNTVNVNPGQSLLFRLLGAETYNTITTGTIFFSGALVSYQTLFGVGTIEQPSMSKPLRNDNCTDRNTFQSNDNKKCEKKDILSEEEKIGTLSTGTQDNKDNTDVTLMSVEDRPIRPLHIPQNNNSHSSLKDFSKSLIDAYERAFDHNITTLDNIVDARPEGFVTRRDFAKMIVEFLRNILKKTDITNTHCTFRDIINENPELVYYMKQACEMGIMGLDSSGRPEQFFYPNRRMSRAEIGTVLSRILFGEQYNVSEQEIKEKYDRGLRWYSRHLRALSNHGIMEPLTAQQANQRATRGETRIILHKAKQQLNYLWGVQ